MSGGDINEPSRFEQAKIPLGTTNSARLADAAMALLGCRTTDEVYEVMCDFMAELCPGAVIIVNEVGPDGDTLITRGLAGLDESLLMKAASVFGVSLIGSTWAMLPEYRDEVLSGQLSRLPGGIAELAGREVPHPVAETGAKLFGVHDVFTVGIADGEHALGSIRIITRTANATVPTHIIESFARHCYSALAGIRAVRQLAEISDRNSLVLRNMTEGLALHEIILDDKGVPCDYRFLDVNPAFEALTGLKAEDIVGRRVLEILPGTEAVWIERYGAVATTGIPARFDDYSSEIGKYYEVVAYSPQPGQFVSVVSDVTERMLSDKVLRESEARFRTMIETFPLAVIMSSQEDGVIEYFNPACTELFGYTIADVPSIDRWWPLAYPDEAYRSEIVAEWVARVERSNDSDAPFEPLESRVTCGDGSVRDVSWGYVAMGDKSYSFGLDLTESVRAREALAYSEAKFSTAFNVSPDAVNINRLSDGLYLDVNQGFTELTGFTKDDVAGKTSKDIDIWCDSADRDRLVAGLRADGLVNNLEAQFQRKDGTLTTALMSARVIVIDDEPCILSVTRDISERIQAERALRESEDKFKYLFEHSVIANSLTQLDGRVHVNDAFLRALGYTREELADGATWQQLTHPDDVVGTEKVVADLVAGKLPSARFTKRYVHKDGSIVWADVSTSLRRDDDGNPEYFMTSILDITERKHAEDEILRLNTELEERVQARTEELTVANQELVESNALLAEADRAKSLFLASMSHELRTPLNSIIGFTGILLQGLAGPLTAEQRLQLGMVSESGKHLLSVIDDILDLAKIESGRTTADLKECDISTLADGALELIRPLADTKDIQLALTRAPEATSLRSDPRLLTQVLINLLGNAVKFTDAGTVSLEISVQEGETLFAVIDTGRGISGDDLPHVLESFYQAETPDTAKTQGTGLGLAISVQLAKILGGTLEVSSEMGMGSTFVLRLPRMPDSGAAHDETAL